MPASSCKLDAFRDAGLRFLTDKPLRTSDPRCPLSIDTHFRSVAITLLLAVLANRRIGVETLSRRRIDEATFRVAIAFLFYDPHVFAADLPAIFLKVTSSKAICTADVIWIHTAKALVRNIATHKIFAIFAHLPLTAVASLEYIILASRLIGLTNRWVRVNTRCVIAHNATVEVHAIFDVFPRATHTGASNIVEAFNLAVLAFERTPNLILTFGAVVNLVALKRHVDACAVIAFHFRIGT